MTVNAIRDLINGRHVVCMNIVDAVLKHPLWKMSSFVGLPSEVPVPKEAPEDAINAAFYSLLNPPWIHIPIKPQSDLTGFNAQGVMMYMVYKDRPFILDASGRTTEITDRWLMQLMTWQCCIVGDPAHVPYQLKSKLLHMESVSPTNLFAFMAGAMYRVKRISSFGSDFRAPNPLDKELDRIISSPFTKMALNETHVEAPAVLPRPPQNQDPIKPSLLPREPDVDQLPGDVRLPKWAIMKMMEITLQQFGIPWTKESIESHLPISEDTDYLLLRKLSPKPSIQVPTRPTYKPQSPPVYEIKGKGAMPASNLEKEIFTNARKFLVEPSNLKSLMSYLKDIIGVNLHKSDVNPVLYNNPKAFKSLGDTNWVNL